MRTRGNSGDGLVKSGFVTVGTSDVTITCGFEPKKIMWYKLAYSGSDWTQGSYILFYDSDMVAGKQFRVYNSTALRADVLTCPDPSNISRISSITSTGFTVHYNSTIASYFQGTYYYVAVG